MRPRYPDGRGGDGTTGYRCVHPVVSDRPRPFVQGLGGTRGPSTRGRRRVPSAPRHPSPVVAQLRLGVPNSMSRRSLLLAVTVAVGVLVLAVAALWVVQRDRVLPNTTVAGVEVGGLRAEEAAAALAPLAEERRAAPVTFHFEERTFTTTPEEIGYEVDLEGTVARAMTRGREHPLRDVATRASALVVERDFDLVESWDADAVVAEVDEIADQVDRERSLGAVLVDPDDLEIRTESPHGAATVRRDETVAELERALRLPGRDALELPVDAEPQPLPDRAIEEAAAQVEAAIDGPLVLSGADQTLTLEPPQLARLLRIVPVDDDDPRLELRVTERRVEEVIGDQAREVFDRAPRDARFTVDRTPPRSFDDMSSTSWSPVAASVGVEPGLTGLRFDPADAAETLAELLRAGAREGELDIEVAAPELPTVRAEELRPTHLLGTFTTYYQAGQVRVANIQRLADVIDGATVLPGEQFSINNISGERTCAKGYQPAGTIVRGELVDTCGGGVSQFGTTTFNAAFFSGLQLDQWKAHSFYISRYPMGREATLSYPELDVRFTNTSDGVVIVKTTHTSTSVTVSIYGRPVATSVSARHGQPFNQRNPETRTRTTSDLPAGRTRTVQERGSAGFTVEVVRTVARSNGSSDSQTIRTVYEPQHGIVERGSG